MEERKKERKKEKKKERPGGRKLIKSVQEKGGFARR